MHAIYQLKEMLCEELEEYGKKGEMSTGSLEVIDKLAHAIKNIDKIIECYEEEGYSNEGQSGNGNMSMDGGSYARRGNRGGGRGYRGVNQYGSYARGGRYSREGGYSRNDGMVEELRKLMQDAPDDKTRQEFERFISKVESM